MDVYLLVYEKCGQYDIEPYLETLGVFATLEDAMAAGQQWCVGRNRSVGEDPRSPWAYRLTCWQTSWSCCWHAEVFVGELLHVERHRVVTLVEWAYGREPRVAVH